MEAFKQLEGTETEAFGKNSYVCRKELGLPMGFERSLLSSNGSFSTCPYALKIVKAIKHGYCPDKQWIKLHLGRGGYSRLEVQVKAERLTWKVDLITIPIPASSNSACPRPRMKSPLLR